MDTGAAYSQAPRSLLVSLGIAPFDRRPVIFADGRRGTCDVGRAEFVANGRQTPALVIFGEESAPPLLGAMTLEGLGLHTYFERIVGSEGTLPRKPDPGGLQWLMRDRGADAAGTVLVG
ncbi:MAG: hypothetical protein AAB254_09600, partial [candidate division NC10 bacterium]